MKYIKTFEEVKPDPEIGDYIVAKKQLKSIDKFIQTRLGEIVHIDNDENGEKYYVVKYSDIPVDLYDYFDYLEDYPSTRLFTRNEIFDFSKDKEYLEYVIKANKYNL
jgi:hypothetical protein